MNKVTPEILIAWIDGELSSQRSSEISTLVSSDAELAEQAAYLEASKLPYKAAMNQNIPVVPDALKAQIEQWSQIADKDVAISKPERKTNYRDVFSGTLAASILLVASWVGLTYFQKPDASEQWTQAIVSYQNFYVAKTVAHIKADEKAAEEKLLKLKQEYASFPLSPPDLTTLGYSFKRVQQLDFAGKPVVQMVFFKEGKRPLAICLMPESETVFSKYTEHELLNSYVWQSDKLRAIVVAEEDSTALLKIASLVGS